MRVRSGSIVETTLGKGVSLHRYKSNDDQQAAASRTEGHPSLSTSIVQRCSPSAIHLPRSSMFSSSWPVLISY